MEPNISHKPDPAAAGVSEHLVCFGTEGTEECGRGSMVFVSMDF